MKLYLHVLLFMVFVNQNTLAQVYNTGVFKVENGTSLYTTGNFTNKGALTADGNLYLKADFVNDNTVTAASGTAYFTGSSTQNITGLTKQVSFYNLNINNTGLGVRVADSLDLVVANSVALTSGVLSLTGEAQLIQTHGGVSANSAVSGKLFISQQGTSDKYKFNYWSSPVNVGGQYSLSSCLYDGTYFSANPFTPSPTVYTSGYDGSQSNPITISNYWIYKFINQADANGWTQIGSSGLLNIGEGFTMKGTGNAGGKQNYVFGGTPNDGTYTHTIGADKMSILGNPYPSALDANQFINDNLASFAPGTVIYFWEHWGGGSHYTADYQGGYSTYSIGGGVAATAHPDLVLTGTGNIQPQRYIPVGQGFFVQAASITGGNFTFNNGQRKFEVKGANSVFTRANQNKATAALNVRVRLGHEDALGFHRQILVSFMEGTTPGVDIGYDAKMIDVSVNDMYWYLDNEAYVIQAQPYYNSMELPLGITSSNEQVHKIMIDQLENFTDPIVLIDTETGLSYNLNDGVANISIPAGTFNTRFKIAFAPTTLSNVENTLNTLKVVYNRKDKNIEIFNPNQEEISRIEVYNISGQLIKRLEINQKTAQDNFTIPFYESNGVYLIKINKSSQPQSFKLAIY
ncbi:MAG: T9SS type A sorting domain-containing protein [Flavobacteriaceae bacterium]|nr:T9SS type A sorting domain-containing protein [Flavobacteriaceae bacterium]